MTILKHRPHPDEAALLAPLAKRPRAGVGSMPPRDDVNFDDLPDPVTKVISFDDVKPEPKDAPARPVRRELLPDAGRIALGFLAAVDGLPARRTRRGRTHLTAAGLPRALPLRHLPLTGRTVAPNVDDVAARDNLLDALDRVTVATAVPATAGVARQWQLLLTAALPIAELLAEPLEIGGALAEQLAEVA